jgi:alpha-L-rhamnosidase
VAARRLHLALTIGCLIAGHAGTGVGSRAVPTPVAAAPDVAVRHLEAHATETPLGIHDAPRYSWRLESHRRGVWQEAAQVLVASSPHRLAVGRADVWDSGRVSSPDPWVEHAGHAVASRTRYYWTVRAWTGPETVTAWAEPTWFETGLLEPSDWKAAWIAGPERPGVLTPAEGAADDAAIRGAGEFCRPPQWLTSGFSARVKSNQGACREVRPAPRLRQTFHVRGPVARARVYASGLASHTLSINGTPASDRVLDPAFTDYSRTVLYTTTDVTPLLRPGENVIASELGSGQYDASAATWDWSWDRAQWRATPRLRLQLHVEYADGGEDVVPTDDTWRVSVEGPTRYDSFLLGETYDARREMRGWDVPGFDASGWPAARVVDAPAGRVRPQTHEPMRVVDVRPPGSRREPARGIFVYDIGQNLTGWATIGVEAPAGTAIEIFYTEKLRQDGTASTEGNALVYGQLQTDYYIARGTGREEWTPRFTYKGFRYVQVSAPGGRGLPDGTRVALERVHQVHSDLPRASTFASGHGTMDRIHRNTTWAVRNNLHGIITDTPVYEKNAWTGDAQLMAGSTSLLFDTERLYWKLLQDMEDAQAPSGELPLLAPTNEHYGWAGKPAFKPADCCGATPAWDAFWFVVPWESYRRHGNVRVLERAWPLMQRYLGEWVPQWTDKDGDGFAHTLTAGLGDWVAPQGVPTINALTSTAYYAHLADIAADVARTLGLQADAARYEALFASIRRDFNARFLGSDGIYRDDPAHGFVQTAQILPLAFGLVPDGQRATVAKRLADDIVQARRGHAWVGVIGARFVLPVLTATGHHGVAWDVATATDEPSWGYWTDVLGFTSLGEHWDANTRSRNHHFFGTIVQWLYEDLAGLQPLEPGYRVIEFRPRPPPGLREVSATHETVRGTAGIQWRLGDDGLELTATVPPGARGRVYVPAADGAGITESGTGRSLPAHEAPSVRHAGREDDRVVYEVGSGRYVFRVEER